MHEEHSADQGTRLAEEVSEERSRAVAQRFQCSPDLRARIVAYSIACRAEGESHQRIADRLGLCQTTLSRWLRRAGGAAPALRSVAIVPSHRRDCGPSQPSSPLRLITPRGIVVEGLDPDLLIAVLREVG